MATETRSDGDISAIRDRVAKEALSWIETPYHHHAQIKGVGVDCAQLLCAVYETVGLIPHVETGHYPVDWHMHRSEEMFSGWLEKFAKPGSGKYEIGDVVLWRFGRTFSHGSIYVGDGYFVHSYIGMGVIRSRAEESPLNHREQQHWRLVI